LDDFVNSAVSSSSAHTVSLPDGLQRLLSRFALVSARNAHGNGCMTFPHPEMQNVLLQHAKSLGVEVRRGATVGDLKPGNPPLVFVGGDSERISARLVVLADGRESRLRSCLGLHVQRDPEQLITAGMVLEGEADCSEILTNSAPGEAKTINLFYDPEGSRMVIAMRIAPRRNRLYLIYHKDVLRRLSGRNSVEEMIQQLQATGVRRAIGLTNLTKLARLPALTDHIGGSTIPISVASCL
jgi:2-polyprenyl-6-methoxyphenol hydroxylase-like FAD-dependent oxidoreductase